MYQTTPIFQNLEPGIYTIFVKDLKGCGVVTKEVSVLGLPKYFTPNNDGFNDYWNLKGVNERNNSNAIIFIFDRYGKLIKQINPLSIGWDGSYQGYPMPANDYWYVITLENGRIIKGHFSLIR
jgi:gliding motility-associated-like protein